MASFTLPEPAEGNSRGLDKPYDQVHLGTAAMSYGNVMVGLYCLWHARPKPGDWFGDETTSGDLGLVISHDGLQFHEPVKGRIHLASTDSPAPPVPGKNLPTILCQANGILNVGEETRIYHGRWRNGVVAGGDYYAEVGLATLPRDRWGALGLFPGKDTGSVWSTPIRLPRSGVELFLNADRAGGITVELADEGFELFRGYSGADRGTAVGAGGLDVPVAWAGRSVALPGGRTVRLRLTFQAGGTASPRLFGISLRRGEGPAELTRGEVGRNSGLHPGMTMVYHCSRQPGSRRPRARPWQVGSSPPGATGPRWLAKDGVRVDSA